MPWSEVETAGAAIENLNTDAMVSGKSTFIAAWFPFYAQWKVWFDMHKAPSTAEKIFPIPKFLAGPDLLEFDEFTRRYNEYLRQFKEIAKTNASVIDTRSPAEKALAGTAEGAAAAAAVITKSALTIVGVGVLIYLAVIFGPIVAAKFAARKAIGVP